MSNHENMAAMIFTGSLGLSTLVLGFAVLNDDIHSEVLKDGRLNYGNTRWLERKPVSTITRYRNSPFDGREFTTFRITPVEGSKTVLMVVALDREALNEAYDLIKKGCEVVIELTSETNHGINSLVETEGQTCVERKG